MCFEFLWSLAWAWGDWEFCFESGGALSAIHIQSVHAMTTSELLSQSFKDSCGIGRRYHRITRSKHEENTASSYKLLDNCLRTEASISTCLVQEQCSSSAIKNSVLLLQCGLVMFALMTVPSCSCSSSSSSYLLLLQIYLEEGTLKSASSSS